MGLLLLCAVLAAAGAPDFVSSGESNEKLHQINSRISRLKKRERYKRQKWGISGKLKKKKIAVSDVALPSFVLSCGLLLRCFVTAIKRVFFSFK